MVGGSPLSGIGGACREGREGREYLIYRDPQRWCSSWVHQRTDSDESRFQLDSDRGISSSKNTNL